MNFEEISRIRRTLSGSEHLEIFRGESLVPDTEFLNELRRAIEELFMLKLRETAIV